MSIIRIALAAVLVLGASSAAVAQSGDEMAPLRDPKSDQPGLNVYDTVPETTVYDSDGNEVDLNSKFAGGLTVVMFYRGGWCPYCNMHLAELRTTEAELTDMGFEVWFVSPDKPELLSQGKDSEFGYRLYSDPEMNAAQAFGIAFRLDDETFERYVGFGHDLNERSGDDHQALPAPATFIIGTDGTVQFGYVNPDYSVRLAPEVLLAAARAYADDAHERLQRRRAD